MSNAQHIARVGALVPPRHGQPGRPPLLVMVAGYSRVTAAVILPSGHSPDLFAGPWELLRRWDRVPRVLLWDTESAVGKWRAGKPELTTAMNVFRAFLGIKVMLCRPGDPEAKRSCRARQRLSGNLVSARPPLQLTGRFQMPS